ncbi:MAG: family 10 glycosylhydrolase [Candidatus Cloacimonetes bacterium]|nr:family 10 glycosylhydrolase [Candidatus Cloacimonadota bacterium]MCK9185316.1 family 10 glycosylhydrolase [Candidatus Cloacimonadota bacterium]
MKRIMTILIILGLGFCLSAEIRSLWVLPWNIQSRQAIDQVISDAVYAHQNEILLEVRYRADALYTPNRLNDDFENPEPRSYILSNDDFDPLAYAIEQARAHQIKVQAWVIVFNATPLDTKLVQNNYIYRNHPEWITYNQRLEKMRTTKQFGYYIDPGIPEVQDYLLDVFSDIVSGYPLLDGLHLDYVRYPDATWGFHPISKRRFDTEGEGLSWNQWRTLQVTEFVTKCHDRIKSINPQIMLSAAVIADIYDARINYAQDWYSWLEQGLIDRAYPMAYQQKFDTFVNHLTQMSQQSDPDAIVVGIRAWDPQGRSLMNTENHHYCINDVAKRIEAIRELGFAGIALFSYEGLKPGNALQHLGDISYFEVPELACESLLSQASTDYSTLGQSWPVLQSQTFFRRSFGVDPQSVDAIFSLDQDLYLINLKIPKEGRWYWELRDAKQRRIYHRYRYYYKGDNEDYWDGLLENGARIQSGRYNLFLSSDTASHQVEVYLRELRHN